MSLVIEYNYMSFAVEYNYDRKKLHMYHDTYSIQYILKNRTANIRELKIYNVNILEIPSEISQLVNLTALYVGDCDEFTFIHPNIAKLKKLKIISLKLCSGLSSLPDMYGMKLDEFSIHECNISHIPIDNTKLLSICHTKITHLPICKNLKSLMLDNNPYLNKLVYPANKFKKIKAIQMSNCEIYNLSPGLIGIILKTIFTLDANITSLMELGKIISRYTVISKIEYNIRVMNARRIIGLLCLPYIYSIRRPLGRRLMVEGNGIIRDAETIPFLNRLKLVRISNV